MPSARRPPKVQRWIDLVAALLHHHYPVSFKTLAVEVPAYTVAGKNRDALMRMFERDKDELRALGVAIQAVESRVGNVEKYQLRGCDFYLPYLGPWKPVPLSRPPARPRGLDYDKIPEVETSAEVIEFIVRATRHVQQSSDERLAHDATAVLRKFSFDLAIAVDLQCALVISAADAVSSDVAAAQFLRLMFAFPELADGKAHLIADVAIKIGTDTATLTRDLLAIATRFEEPRPGFIEEVQLSLTSDTVALSRCEHFRRPMALTKRELRALDFGLTALRHEFTSDPYNALAWARMRLGPPPEPDSR